MRSFQTVAALTCMKTLLILFNVLFWVSGIVLLILGVYLHVELHKIVDVSNTTGSSSVPVFLIGTGVLVLFLATLACCCTINEQPILLYVYAGFLSVVFVIECTAVLSGYAYRTELSNEFIQGLNKSMQVYNVDYSRTSSINSIQAHLKCCGINSPNDWTKTPYGKVPGSCCKENFGCDTSDKRFVYKQGCSDEARDLLTRNFETIMYSGLGIVCFQGLGIALTIMLGTLVQKTKYEQMS